MALFETDFSSFVAVSVQLSIHLHWQIGQSLLSAIYHVGYTSTAVPRPGEASILNSLCRLENMFRESMRDGMCKGRKEIAFQVEAIGHRLVSPWSLVRRSLVICIISIHFESRLFGCFRVQFEKRRWLIARPIYWSVSHSAEVRMPWNSPKTFPLNTINKSLSFRLQMPVSAIKWFQCGLMCL